MGEFRLAGLVSHCKIASECRSAVPELRRDNCSNAAPVSTIWRHFQSLGECWEFQLSRAAVDAEPEILEGPHIRVGLTFSKELDNLIASPRNPANNALERALGTVDRPSVLTASFVYQLPFGSGRQFGSPNRVVGALIDNWQVAGVVSYSSGAPFDDSRQRLHVGEHSRHLLPELQSLIHRRRAYSWSIRERERSRIDAHGLYQQSRLCGSGAVHGRQRCAFGCVRALCAAPCGCGSQFAQRVQNARAGQPGIAGGRV
jgi:hypothetical protein